MSSKDSGHLHENAEKSSSTKSKNYVMLAIIIALIILVYSVTIVKLSA